MNAFVLIYIIHHNCYIITFTPTTSTKTYMMMMNSTIVTMTDDDTKRRPWMRLPGMNLMRESRIVKNGSFLNG